MSLFPRRGQCLSCGHDHGEGMGSPRELELLARIRELEGQNETLSTLLKLSQDALHRMGSTSDLSTQSTDPENVSAKPENIDICQHKNSTCVYESDDGEFERHQCNDCGERFGVEIPQ